jgi:hypothetical protein
MGAVRRFFDEGKISARVIERARGAYPANQINNSEFQRRSVPGFRKGEDFGPDDAGHIDARANRRKDTEARVGGQSLPGNAPPSQAQVRRISADEYWQSSWYGGPARRQE